MKIRKIMAGACALAMAVSFAACSKNKDKDIDKDTDETVETTDSQADSEGFQITVTIDGEVHEMQEGDIIYSESSRNWREFNGASFDSLDINGITIGSSLTELDDYLVSGYTYINYEYDPYGDGCTAVNEEIYDGTLPDLDEDVVLDLEIMNMYVEEDGHWVQIPYDKEADYEDKVILLISFDIYAHCTDDDDMFGKVGMIYSTYCYRNSSIE